MNFAGKPLRVEGARTLFPPLQRPYPALYSGGSSPAGIEVTARHVDHYLTWGEPPAAVAEKIAAVRAAAQRQGRQMRFGIRLHLIVREMEEEAWAGADRLISRLSDGTVATAQATLDRQDSHGQKRMLGLQQTRGINRSRHSTISMCFIPSRVLSRSSQCSMG